MVGARAPGIFRGVVSRPEIAPAALLILSMVLMNSTSSDIDAAFLLRSSPQFMEIGLMAIGMTFVIIAGQIDLSVASTLALVACVSGKLLEGGSSIPVACGLGVALGAALGWLNGVLVSRLRLPSFVVTLATMALYRGAAQVLTRSESIKLPSSFAGIQYLNVPGTPIPAPLAIFLVLGLLFGLVLHRTIFGRWLFAVGTNEEAAYYSGVPTARVKTLAFVLTGALSGAAGLMMNSRLTVGRFDHARTFELDVITAVLLGGASIYGGRGSMLGSVLALCLIGIVRKEMGVANVPAPYQLTIVGSLLILAVIVGNLGSRIAGGKTDR